jgi:putative peptidoglycan lipid II flippase
MTMRLARSAGLIGIATMSSRLLGVAREMVFAAAFGAGNAMDAFNIAFRIPNLLRDLFAEGAMTAAFVPTFTRTLGARGREAAWRLGNHVINALLVITGLCVVAGVVFADEIAWLLASDYAGVPGKLELTAFLTRLQMPFLTTVAVSVALMGMLNSLHRFFVPALSPAMFNVATIACALLLAPLMPRFGLEPIVALGIGTVLGGLGQILIQWPFIRREGFRYRLALDTRDDDLRDVLRLMVPGTLGLAAVQVNVLVNSWLATSQGEGAVSWLNYAFRLMYLPIGLFGVSIATAALPAFARAAAVKDVAAMRGTLSGGLRMMLMLNVPATLGLIALAGPIVQLLLERGAFQPSDASATAAALVFYAPGLLGYSAVKIASPSFYALGDSRTPVAVSVASMGTNFLLNVTLVRVLGYRGLALGTAAAALLNAIVLWWLLSRRLGGLEGRRVAVALAKITVASLLMAASAVFTHGWLETRLPGGSVAAQGVRVFGAIAAAIAVLGASARLLRIEEFEEAARRVLARAGIRR